MGKTGRGICEHFDVPAREVDLLMGTISKSLGSCGGYLAGSKSLIDYLKFTTPSMVFSTAAPPSSVAAALESIRVLIEQPHRLSKLRENAELFLKLAKDAGLNTGASYNTPIIPIILSDSRLCLWMSQQLLERGINAQPILYPAVPESASRMRFFVTALHSEEQIHTAVQTVAELRGRF
jgi:7-keto-8-aminopelargonate synthetase-like enzyme